MIHRSFTALSLVLIAAAPLAAQMDHSKMDMDKKVHGGALPAGWAGRTDDASKKLEDAKFTTMGTGFHVTSGPAAIYWAEKGKVNGPFTASATFRQTKAPEHPEAYGLFFQGNKLNSADQNYAYFLVRGDGKFLINHRAGKEIHKIVDWTSNAAIKKQDDKGVAVNTLSIDASKPDSVRLLVNGTQVHALDLKHLGSVAGNVGLRVNHNLDVHVSDLTIAPTKK